ncbi:3-galactosyl-N-acetylglucosaminide 4-alpha-L-fucosyltransferase FUT3 [Xenopus laevis]|uniref:Fucosyltransferase n=2 Tax=Xenopus laevis TaxID=8355 RepID=A0A974C465_XENLA|nr:3-galactosyl-N-acetylglucosaminide 4-alpha-L-fucosyltransferase FUT3 [Xenopus laevis]OCT66235.1 hypothetical protein XELAEV_18042493mg [Xenopus laevis]
MALRQFIQKNVKWILPLFLFIVLLSFTWRRSVIIPVFLPCQETETIKNKNLDTKILTEKKETELVILVWVYPFGQRFPLDICGTDYGISGCKLTADRELYNVSDAVIIHHFDTMYNKDTLPQTPRPHYQRWVWFNLEPPLIIQNLHFLDNLFNLTMTFRQDSDIYIPYGRIEAAKEPQNVTIPLKSKLVAWVVSKWYPGAPRVKYYEELKKHISVDIYGTNHLELNKKDFNNTISEYKFYLAFENSIYKDYITEKIWSNAFGTWSVPVVLGTSRKNYERFIPGDAFIHVDDFSSAKELADFLLQLDKDDDRYRKYFHWRHQHRVILSGDWAAWFCKACRVLKQKTEYQVIHSVEKWFLGNASFNVSHE